MNGNSSPVKRERFTDAAIFIGALTLYTFTLAPGLLPADSGEYQTTGAILGVAHPPGYAAYTLLSWLISRFPFVSPAVAISFLSALFAALTLVCVSRAVRAWTGSTFAGVGAALALGFSTTFWAQATTTNIRMFTALGIALAVMGLAEYFPLFPNSGNSGKERKLSLAAFAFGLGLAVSHHGSTVFLALALALYFLLIYVLQDWSVVRLMWVGGLPKRAGLATMVRQLWPLTAGLIPFLSWGYFLFRPQAFGALANAGTWDGFLDQVFARDALGAVAVFATPELFPDRLRVLWVILNFQWHWLILLGVGIGGVLLIIRNWKLGVALFFAFAIHTFFSITYAAPQTAEYLLPSYVLLTIPLGFAFAHPLTLSSGHPFTKILRPLILSAALILQFSNNYSGYRALAQDDSTGEFTRAVLQQAPPNAVILANWHWATPLWYLQEVEGQRPDVAVRYVFPRGASYAQNWVEDARAVLPTRPVLVTSFFKPEYAASGLRFVPLATPHFPVWQILDAPLTAPPVALSAAQNFGELDFLGYQVINNQSPITLLAAWKINGAPRDINFFLQAIGPDGLLYGQQDVNYPASRYVNGEVLIDRYTLTLLPEAQPGTYQLLAGAYGPDGVRVAEAALSTLTVTAKTDAPGTTQPFFFDAARVGRDVDFSLPDSVRVYEHQRLAEGYATFVSEQPPSAINAPATARYVSFDEQIILTRAEPLPASVRRGQTLTLSLEFMAARSLNQDLTVKAAVVGQNWSAAVDTTPVGGGLP
ncbi:MAG: DUF2723 domain-containing protein, partial [Anaerolineales bacterium]|nr:DUF2723 domain-containing protein [Anaerolineales bacterium]